MEENVKNSIKEYQCSGCICGSNVECFQPDDAGCGCGKHMSGTIIHPIGNIFLGMPKGFNRLGINKNMRPKIFETFDGSNWGKYDMWNIPVWKYLNEDGHTMVRGLSPRINSSFLHIYLENCLDKINCLEITQSDIDGMD